MIYLGLDLGTKTVGMAISDPSGIIATALETYHFKENDLQKAVNYVKMVVENRGVDKIVLGLPKNMDGTLGFQSTYVQTFKTMLEKETKKPVILVDERLTSVQVNKILIDADLSRKKRKDKIDALAARLILQSYLDSPKKE
jgi:putative Holliday junction resolvase